MEERYLIVNDSTGRWFIRHVETVTADLWYGKKNYTCDKPVCRISGYDELEEAVADFKKWRENQ